MNRTKVAKMAGNHSPVAAAGLDSAQREVRCECNNLLARILAGEIELKCRRCKRLVTLQVGSGASVGLDVACRCDGE